MSMSLDVYAVKTPDAEWLKMKAVWEACKAAGVKPPKEVVSFFDDESPDPLGVVSSLRGQPCVADYSAEMQSGFQVEISKLPPGTKFVRFVCTW